MVLPTALRMAVVALGSFVVAAACATLITRIAVRTRLFATPDRSLDTWHGRPLRQSERESREGLNPFLLAVATVALGALLIG